MLFGQTIARARLVELDAKASLSRALPAGGFEVQFNPESLTLSFANEKKGGENKRGTEALQYVGSSTGTLTVQLLFDVTVAHRDGQVHRDVRALTGRVRRFVEPRENYADGDKTRSMILPRVLFAWGTFLFDGVVESFGETLDFFSKDGHPLRATVDLTIKRVDDYACPREGSGPGTTAQNQVRQGDTMQQMAARAGRTDDWKALAAANGIENPRRLAPGTLLDMSRAAAARGAGARPQAEVDLQVGARAGVRRGLRF